MNPNPCPNCGRPRKDGADGLGCLPCLLRLGAEDLMETVPDGPTGQAETEAFDTGSHLGRYELIKRVGEGTFGVVWLAEQREPIQRRVALKVLKPGMDSRQVLARFDAERQALALMDHPNIARVFDAGTTPQGRPYIVMEFVDGHRITDYCDRFRLTPTERLQLFIQVCKGIQHAHQKGIIHRDLKPSNILVVPNEEDPRLGTPKVIDFGIIKAVGPRAMDFATLTGIHQIIGTPIYMSPEQAGLNTQDIDTRSDLYSLGVLLYELLTGHTPFDAQQLVSAGIERMWEIIREKDPARPSTHLSSLDARELATIGEMRNEAPPRLMKLIQGDLDCIIMKCLEKDRSRRYGGPDSLMADIDRHLNQLPITARPPSLSYRAQKWIRRNRVVFVSAVVLTMALVLGTTLSTWQALRATRAERQQDRLRTVAERALERETTARALAETNATKVQTLLSQFYSAKAEEEQQKDNLPMSMPWLVAALKVSVGNPELEHRLRIQIGSTLGLLPTLDHSTTWKNVGWTNSMLFHQHASWHLNADLRKLVVIKENTDSESYFEMSPPSAQFEYRFAHFDVLTGEFAEAKHHWRLSPGGLLTSYVVSPRMDRISGLVNLGTPSAPRWHVAAWQLDPRTGEPMTPTQPALSENAWHHYIGVFKERPQYLADGNRITFDSGFTSALMDARTGTSIWTGRFHFDNRLHQDVSEAQSLQSTSAPSQVQSSPSPKALLKLSWLLSTSPFTEVRDGARALQLALRAKDLISPRSTAALECVAAAHAELGDYESAIRVQREALAESEGNPEDQLRSDRYGPFPSKLDCLKLYESGQAYRRPNKLYEPKSVDWSPKGDFLLYSGRGPFTNEFRIWNISSNASLRIHLPFTSLRSATFSHDGKIVACLGELPASVHVVESRTGRILNRIAGPETTLDNPATLEFCRAEFSPDDQRLVLYSKRFLGIFDTQTWALLGSITDDRLQVDSIGFSADNRRVVIASKAGYHVRDLRSGMPVSSGFHPLVGLESLKPESDEHPPVMRLSQDGLLLTVANTTGANSWGLPRQDSIANPSANRLRDLKVSPSANQWMTVLLQEPDLRLVQIWDAKSKAVSWTLKASPSQFLWSRTGETILSVTPDTEPKPLNEPQTTASQDSPTPRWTMISSSGSGFSGTYHDPNAPGDFGGSDQPKRDVHRLIHWDASTGRALYTPIVVDLTRPLVSDEIWYKYDYAPADPDGGSGTYDLFESERVVSAPPNARLIRPIEFTFRETDTTLSLPMRDNGIMPTFLRQGSSMDRILIQWRDNLVRLHSITNPVDTYLEVQAPERIRTARFSRNGRDIAMAFADGSVGLWSLDSKTFKHSRPDSANHAPMERLGSIDVGFSEDERYIVLRRQSYKPLLASNGQILDTGWRTLFPEDYSPILRQTTSKTWYVYDRSDLAPVFLPQTEASIGHGLGRMPCHVKCQDGTGITRVVTPGSSNSVSPLIKTPFDVTQARLSPDETMVATTCIDGTARVWDARSGAPLTPPLKHGLALSSCAFLPDGSGLVTAREDGALTLWPLRPDSRSFEVLESVSSLISLRRLDETGALVELSKTNMLELLRHPF